MKVRHIVFAFFITVIGFAIQPPLALQAAQESKTVSGTVIQTMNASGYTYMQVDTGSAKSWVAIPETSLQVGDTVNYLEGMVMSNFQSKTLNRTFPSIVFSSGLQGQKSFNPHGTKPTKVSQTEDSFSAAVQAEKTQSQAPKEEAVSGGSAGAMAPFTEIKVEKIAGENGYTVEEIFSNSQELDGKIIRVRGKVVKYNPNIMGKNWIHIQDGSGDPMENTHDLVVTTTEQLTSEDIIVIEGKMTANKDFGAGYSYTALIEEAKLVKE